MGPLLCRGGGGRKRRPGRVQVPCRAVARPPGCTYLATVRNAIGMRSGVKTLATMNALLLPARIVFICDTYVNYDPSVEEIAAEEVKRFGLEPKVALLSHSSFGTHDTPSALKWTRPTSA